MVPTLAAILEVRADAGRQPRRHAWNGLLLVVLFAAAFGIRLFGLTQPPLEFHPVKQYRSALTARSFYYRLDSTVEAWRADVAHETVRRIGILGPPVADLMGAAAYWALGREALWVPRLFSVLSWMCGGVFLYLLGRRLSSPIAGSAAAGFYLFFPFGVVASQSFQPDPLMVTLTIAALYFLVRQDDSPTPSGAIAAAATAGLAILVKPVSLFLIFAAAASLAVNRHGFRSSVWQWNGWRFLGISLLPAAAYYFYSVFVSGSLAHQAEKSFLPQLLLDPNFWDGWAKRIRIAIGFTPVVAGMAGTLLVGDARARRLLWALWSGYVAMCFAFTYTISTHDYYHLPLVPVVALAMGELAVAFSARFSAVASVGSRLALAVVILLAVVLAAGTSVQARRRVPSPEATIRVAREIGRTVGHSTRTIHLAEHDGKPLMYYGELAGDYWPYWWDIRDERLWGEPLTVDARFKALNARQRADFFIVTDLAEFAYQGELQTYLTSRYPVFAETDDYVIFDLRSLRSGPGE